MDTTQILIAIIAGLGLKEIWSIWKKYIDKSSNNESFIRNYKVNRIEELEKKNESLTKEIGEKTANIARLEERLLHVAKNRVKK